MLLSRAAVRSALFVLSVALLGTACSKPIDTGEVSARTGEYGARLQTSTTLDGATALSGRRSPQSSDDQRRAEATTNLAEQLKNNPELLAQLGSLTPEQLAELTGLSVAELDTLGITPATVAAMGELLVAGQSAAGPGTSTDPAFAALAAASGIISKEAVAVLSGADPTVLAALFGASLTVDSSVTEPLGQWLKVFDPNGLGRYSEDQSMLAVMAVVLGAQLGGDPVPLENFGKLPPDLQGVLQGIAGLAEFITPTVVRELNRMTTLLGPEVLSAIGGLFTLLDQPEVAAVVRKAVEDPLTFASILGSAALLVPGLAEALNPGHYDTSEKRIQALGLIFIVSLVRADPIGLKAFLDSIGVELPPEFWQGIPPA